MLKPGVQPTKIFFFVNAKGNGEHKFNANDSNNINNTDFDQVHQNKQTYTVSKDFNDTQNIKPKDDAQKKNSNAVQNLAQNKPATKPKSNIDNGNLGLEAIMRETLSTQQQNLGVDHAVTLSSTHDLAVFLQNKNRLDEAEQYFRTAFSGRLSVLGFEHQDTVSSLHELFKLLQKQGKLEKDQISKGSFFFTEINNINKNNIDKKIKQELKIGDDKEKSLLSVVVDINEKVKGFSASDVSGLIETRVDATNMHVNALRSTLEYKSSFPFYKLKLSFQELKEKYCHK